MSQTKPFTVSKDIVFSAYERVARNKGTYGVDKQSLEQFEENVSGNLFKIWNRLSSGSYFPPAVRRVLIPKGGGKMRPLGIPTVGDRIAQTVVKEYIEPRLERLFHEHSYGYRPNKSAHEAVGTARKNCWRSAWVVDLDIEGFFDSIDHTLLMKAVCKHVQEPWILLCIQRWLQAPVQYPDGRVESQKAGTPQGGVISPLLANLFLHYVFDVWMDRYWPSCSFERYADDVICHCQSEGQARLLLKAIRERMQHCGLKLHPLKTKVVCCRAGHTQRARELRSFEFLGFDFCERTAMNKSGKRFRTFLPALSKRKENVIREHIKADLGHRWKRASIEDIAYHMNAKVRGWYAYFSRFYPSISQSRILRYVDERLAIWAGTKYKHYRQSPQKAWGWLLRLRQHKPNLFWHWQVV